MTKLNAEQPSKITLSQLKVPGPIRKNKKQGITVMTPKHTLMSIHPENRVQATVINHDNQWYLLAGHIASECKGNIKKLATAMLYQGLTSQGGSFILPVTEPWPGYPSSWEESLKDIVEDAKTEWVKLEKDDDLKLYNIYKTQSWTQAPAWPKDDFETLLAKAFPGENYITDIEHPVLEALYNDYRKK